MKTIGVLIFFWGIFSFFLNMNQYFLPDITDFFCVFFEEVKTGAIIMNIASTFIRLLLGLLIGVIFGVAVGLVLGLSDGLRKEMMPLVDFLRGIPTSMLFPVFIVAFGIGEISKIIIVISATVPVMLINTMVGCMPRPETQTRRDYLRIHSTLLPVSVKLFAVVWDALPSIIAGFKTAISIALVLTIVTEMFFVASSGVGWAAHQAYLSFDLETMYCYVVVVGAIGLLLNYLFNVIQGILVPEAVK